MDLILKGFALGIPKETMTILAAMKCKSSIFYPRTKHCWVSKSSNEYLRIIGAYTYWEERRKIETSTEAIWTVNMGLDLQELMALRKRYYLLKSKLKIINHQLPKINWNNNEKTAILEFYLQLVNLLF